MAGNPFRSSPAENWAQNFQDNVEKVDRFNDKSTMEKYKRNVKEAFSRAGINDIDASDDSKAVQAFSNVHNNDTYDAEAVKTLTVLAAAEYLDTTDSSDRSASIPDEVDTDSFEELTDYDAVDVDSQFDDATQILGAKFVNNWAQAYK